MLDFGTVTNGVSEEAVKRFMRILGRYGFNDHAVIICRNGKLCYEHYRKPYDKDTPHRMYSVTKSFVSIAIGCLIADGKLDINDPIIKYFPDKLPDEIPDELRRQTVRDMLMMFTCFEGCGWFGEGITDRTAFYFSNKPDKPSGTLFDYDSNGSYVLGVLVERLSGKPLLEYMREKVLDEIGGFENAEILVTPDGTSWGDSALICTPRALANFAQCVMDGGKWNGRQVLDESYIKEATSRQTDNNMNGKCSFDHYGYGYQIWKTERNGFSFNGMGCQYAVCIPDKDLLVVVTGENQINAKAKPVLFRAIFEELADPLYDDEPIAYETDELYVCRGAGTSSFAEKINGVRFECKENSMGISSFSLLFNGDEGVFRYTNAQGEKELFFGIGKNVFTYFPELGYSNERGNVHELTDFKYRCAVSGGWVDDNKFQISVQVIDKYLGELCITVGFNGNGEAGVSMVKAAEDFFRTYDGFIIAHRYDKGDIK